MNVKDTKLMENQVSKLGLKAQNVDSFRDSYSKPAS